MTADQDAARAENVTGLAVKPCRQHKATHTIDVVALEMLYGHPAASGRLGREAAGRAGIAVFPGDQIPARPLVAVP